MSVRPANVRTIYHFEALPHQRWSRLTTTLLIAVFFSGIFEGAARKWLLPTEIPEVSYIAYLSKFIAFWLIYLAVPASAPLSRSLYEWRRYLLAGLVMLLSGALLSAFSGFSVAGGFLTVVMVAAGPVLAYLATPIIRMANLRQVLQWIAVMSLFPAVLGLIQFELPVTHVLNKYVGDSGWTAVITDLGRVRATGTFSFISGMTAMTVLGVWSGMSLRALSAKARDQSLGLFAVVAGFTSGFAALSRSAVFMGLALVAVRLLFVGRDRQLLILIVVGMLGYGYLSVDRPTSQVELKVTLVSGVFIRQSRSDSVLDRFGSWATQLSDAIDTVPLGNGFGVNQIGGRAVETGRRVLVSYEAELARLVAEVGVPGVLGVLVIRIGLLLVLFHAWRGMVNSPVRDALLLSIAALSLFFVSNTAFNHVAAGFVWPIAAIALAWASNGKKVGASR
ncbi:MAG: hypothetical protein BMS9Abin05_1237 [Rhodothermia bacterium]|nr:MAG: hypothetical protein BMS9Abin05_1237 [Rhodothermia bacterium]